jgi:DNA-binding response OmpR family regulator
MAIFCSQRYDVLMAHEKILVVEDDADISKALRYNLEKEGYRVVSCADGESALALAGKEKPGLLILDLMLPKLDGLEVCRRLRQGSRVPVLMLTAKKNEVDRILGLRLGADDYMVKPFSMGELLARVQAILRRAAAPEAEVRRIGDLELDFDRHEARLKGAAVDLTPREFELIRRLVQAGGRVLSREDMLEKIWGYENSMEIDTRTVDQHIARARGKLGSEAWRIITVKNVGYRMKAD